MSLRVGELVFIHGLFSGSSTWDRFASAISEDPDFAGLRLRRFDYESPRWRFPFSPKRIPDYNDIEDSLRPFLRLEDRADQPLGIVTHSQGGLILQRFLASAINSGRAQELASIRFVMLLACPNEGSQYLEAIRRMTGTRRHPQIKDLHPLSSDVQKARQTVLKSIVHAASTTDRDCRIPMVAYVGRTDNVVKAPSAKGAFSETRTIAGNHFSILDPKYSGSSTLSELKRLIGKHWDGGDTDARSKADLPIADSDGGAADYDPAHSKPVDGQRYEDAPTLLPSDIADFEGRDDDVRTIRSWLPATEEGRFSAIINLYGKPGVGKSALAVHVAWQLRDAYPDGRVHLSLRGQDGEFVQPTEVLTLLIRRLGVPNDDLGPAHDRANQLQALLASRRVLLILDNAKDEKQVRAAMPHGIGCAVVLTSRQPLAALEGVRTYRVETVTSEDGIRLLAAAADRADDKSAAMAEVVDLCGHLPLALRVAGAILKSHPTWRPEDLAARLRDRRTRVARLHVGDLDVISSFALSLEDLPDNDVTVLRTIATAMSARTDARRVAGMVAFSLSEVEDSLDRLAHAQLVEEEGTGNYSLHDLIRLFAIELPARAGLPAPGADATDVTETRVTVAAPTSAALQSLADSFTALYLPELTRSQRMPALLPSLGMPDASLDEVYVPQRLEWSHAINSSPQWYGDDLAQPGSPRRLVLLGAPGSGKTVLAHRTMTELADRHERGDRSTPVPLLLPVSEWTDGPLLTFVASRLRALYDVDVTVAVLQHMLETGTAQLVIDGLDEAAVNERRTQIADQIIELAQRFPEARIMVLSRPAGYATAPLPATIFDHAWLQDWTAQQLNEFLSRLAARQSGSAPGTADAFRQLLETTPQFGELASNPLMLKQLFRFFHSRGVLPRSRVDVYEQIAVDVWERLDSERGINAYPGPDASADRQRNALIMEHIAHRAVRPPVGASITYDDVWTAAERVGSLYGDRETSQIVDTFLDWVESRGTLLTVTAPRTQDASGRSSAKYEFYHRGVRDFLASRHLVDGAASAGELATQLGDLLELDTSSQVLEFSMALYSRRTPGGMTELGHALLATMQGTELLDELRPRLIAALEYAQISGSSQLRV